MGDALESNVTIVALIVSSVALVITANQHTPQLFSLADSFQVVFCSFHGQVAGP